MSVEIVGYEGEWFDPGDVQGYLEEKGIFIDPAATFAEADMVVEQMQLGSGASSDSSTRARTPGMAGEMQDVSMMNDADGTQWDDIFAGAGLTSVGFSDAQTGSFMNFLQPGEAIKRTAPQPVGWTDDWLESVSGAQDLGFGSETTAVGRQARTKKVVIDVRKLVKGEMELASQG